MSALHGITGRTARRRKRAVGDRTQVPRDPRCEQHGSAVVQGVINRIRLAIDQEQDASPRLRGTNGQSMPARL